MTQLKSKASRLGGRLYKSVATSAFVLSALAGGVMLSGGQAKAFNCSFGGAPMPPTACSASYNMWVDSNPVATDKQIKFANSPSNASGDIEWKWVDVSGNGDWHIPPDMHSVDEWHVDVDFNPDLMPGDLASIFEYAIRITEPGYHFEDVSLDSIIGPGSGMVTKDIYDFTNDVKGSLLATLTNKGTYTPPPYTYTKFYIVDTATPGTSTIDSYQNIYRQTPGPLPILGAGAAFGFSRKVRGRIKAARTA